MTRAEILAQYCASLGEVEQQFQVPNHGDYLRHLNTALPAMTHKRPLLKRATLTLVADEPYYTADLPLDIDSVHSIVWPSGPSTYNYPAPRLLYQPGFITVSPTPSTTLVACFPTVSYQYYAKHSILADSTTLRDNDVPLLILRAQAEAMRELAMRSHQKPVSLRGGSGGGALSNMQPSALYEMLLAEFQRTP